MLATIDNANVIFSLIVVLFVSIIGCYGLIIKIMGKTTEQLAQIYKTVNAHINSTSVHVDAEKPYVTTDVCTITQKKIAVEFKYLKEGQDNMKEMLKCIDRKLN